MKTMKQKLVVKEGAAEASIEKYWAYERSKARIAGVNS